MELSKPVKRLKAPKPIRRTSRPRQRRRGKNASPAREADRLWSLIVRHRGCCESPLCGSREHLQAAHGISRRYRGTRWLPINGFCLCAKHHVFYTHRPLEWQEWLRAAWGELVYRELNGKAIRVVLSGEKPDLEAIVESLRCELYKLEGQPPLQEVK